MNFPEKKSFNMNGALHLLFLIICVAALGTATFGQKTRSFGDRSLAISQPVAVESAQPEATTPPPTFADEANTTCANLVGLRSSPGGPLLFPGVTAATHQFKYG